MKHNFFRIMLTLGGLPALLVIFCSAASIEKAPAKNQGPKFAGMIIGETTQVVGRPGSYERVLLAPPDEGKMMAGNAWEVSADLAIKLGLLDHDERWRVIRRNLGLAPEETTDLVLWTEVVDALLAQIGMLPLEKDLQKPAFGLRVAFPGQGSSESAKADVALTFNSDQTFDRKSKQDFESRLNQNIVEALTGAEGFVIIVDENGSPLPADEADDVLKSLKIRLYDQGGREYVPELKGHSYFRFSPLPADPEFGSDYRLRVTMIEKKSSDEGGAGGKEVPIKLSNPEGQYVPVRQGVRTRLDLTLNMEDIAKYQRDVAIQQFTKAIRAGQTSTEIPGAPAAISMLFQTFVGENPLLGAVMQALPMNPGLHFGLVQAEDSGWQLLWSVRFLLKSPEQDRRPRFVTRGTIRLQCLAAAAPEGRASARYLKITWSGRTDPAQLDLRARPVIEFPLGVGAGVVPSLDPALYAVGASYKLFHICEIFAGAGIRKDHPTTFVYGVTLNVEDILSALFGKVAKPEGGKSEASAELSGQEGQGSKTENEPSISRSKGDKK